MGKNKFIEASLVIAPLIPEPNSTAAGTRMLKLLRNLLRNSNKVYFLHIAAQNENSHNLAELGIECFKIEVNDDTFDELIQKLNPSLVLFDRFYTEEQFSWRVDQYCPNALKVLDLEDLHSLRASREKCVQEQCTWNPEFLNQHPTALRELASIYRCDLTLVISSYEMELLQKHWNVPQYLLLYYPMFFGAINAGKDFEARKNIVMLGNFMHAPNWDAVKYTQQSIVPALKKILPEVRIDVYGAYQQGKHLNTKDTSIQLKGKADDLVDTLSNYRLMLAPLRFGAGLKGKILDAYQNNLPVIGSRMATEGMPLEYFDLDALKIATALKNYYNNAQDWHSLKDKAQKALQNSFDAQKFDEIWDASLEKIVLNFSQQRNANIIGKILKQEQFKSTKYLAKWISLKNAVK